MSPWASSDEIERKNGPSVGVNKDEFCGTERGERRQLACTQALLSVERGPLGEGPVCLSACLPCGKAERKEVEGSSWALFGCGARVV